MRRTALLLVVLAAALGMAAAGCGGEQEQTATPETVEGATTTEPTETETTEPETTETETTETETETTETETTETETETTAPAEGDPVAGKEVFLGSAACGGCHTLADAGTSGTVGPNLDETMPDYELALDRVTNGQGGMPAFSSTLSEQQLADVAAYVSSVAGQ
jgi:mono/diheme cytochrome c family protein